MILMHMMTKKSYNFFLWTIYLLVLSTSMNSTGMMNFYILMEMMMLMFLYISIMKKKNYNLYSMSEKMYYYLVIQTMSSIILLTFIVMKDTMYMNMIEMNFITMFLLFFKMGIYPFSFWMYKLTSMNNMTFFMMLVLQKFPLLILMELLNSEKTIMMLIMNMIIGSLNMMFSKNLKEVLISSSLYSMFWIYMFINFSMTMFIMYYSLYFMSMIMLLYKKKEKILYPIIFYLMSVGLPPMGTFFMKFEMMMNLMTLNLNLKIMMFFSLMMSLIGYTSQFMTFMFNKYNFYKMKNISSKINYMFFFFNLMLIM
nr:NADH dehydrogenase subunit 2 [Nothopoda sp.]